MVVPVEGGLTVLAVARANGATLYAAPNGSAHASLLPATALTASARDASSQWIYVTSTDGAQGWAKISELVIFGVEELAVFEGSVPEPAAIVATTDDAAPAEAAAAAVEAGVTETTVEATPETSEAAAVPPASETVAGTANVSGARLNIRSGPGQDYRIIGKASPGEELAIAARTGDGEWLQVRRANLPNGFGWVAATLVQLESEVGDLPVSDEISSGPPTAVPAATPVPTAVPAAGLQPATPAAPATVERTGSTGLTGTLVFQDGLGSLYVYDLGRGEVRRLTNGFDPDASRDGSKVIFTRGGAIYAINTDGSGLREVYSGSELITSPKWSPDGEWIVFSRLLGTYKCFNTEFLGCVTLVELGAMFPQIPPQFLDKLVSSEDRIELPNYGISRINASGKEFRDLNALDSAQAPDWNEDGIVYQSKAGVEVTADTPDGQTRSVLHDKWDWDPDWQPNGGRVVFQSREGPHWEIWSMNPDGSGLVALTKPETTLVDQLPSNVSPAWSPDGKYVVYVSNRDENEDAGPWRLWVMNADGSNKRPLPVKIPISYGFGSEQMVSWGQ
ncbi:MAG: SH3 domain-containing protein [Caldilineaceae bacterium]|nr:SH3 domain-containing protein [Caldilineaceae bacterium]